MSGPSGTGHDSARAVKPECLAGEWTPRRVLNLCRAEEIEALCRVLNSLPVAVPGPASELLPCTCHGGDEPYCPRHTPLPGEPAPGPASVSPAEPFKRPSSYRPEFEKHASPEAIQAHIVQARNHAESIQYELGWLEGLYLRRVAEKAAGRWP